MPPGDLGPPGPEATSFQNMQGSLPEAFVAAQLFLLPGARLLPGRSP